MRLKEVQQFTWGHRTCRGGNGSPLLWAGEYSCLENPVDGGAWWAAVHRIAQSQTRLKRLSMHACTEEGNGNPLQYSFLENPRGGGAWLAAVYGVVQSRTWQKWLSSSSSIELTVDRAGIWSRKIMAPESETITTILGLSVTPKRSALSLRQPLLIRKPREEVRALGRLQEFPRLRMMEKA